MAHELYRHFDKDGVLLYVGISLSTVERTRGHRASANWFDKIVRIEIERHPSHKDAAQAELEAIGREKPVYNRWTDKRKGVSARDPVVEAKRQVVIQEATRLGIKINKQWCLSYLQKAVDVGAKGVPYPYQ